MSPSELRHCLETHEHCKHQQSINIKLERSEHLLSQRTSADQDERPSTATNTLEWPKYPLSVVHTQELVERRFNFLPVNQRRLLTYITSA